MPRGRFAAALYALAVAALVLRWLGTDWGRPFEYHFDEPFIVKPALRIVASGDLNPHFFRYPSLLIYAESIVVATAHSVFDMPLAMPQGPGYGPSDLATETWPAVAGGRRMVAVLGALGVLAAGSIAHAAGGMAAGVLAALLLAVFPLHVEHSQYLTTDVPASTFVLLAFAALAGASVRRSAGLAGVAVGLACACKYTAAAAAPAVLLLVLIDPRIDRRAKARRAVELSVAAALAFLVTSPFALLDLRSFLAELAIVRAHYTQGHLGAQGSANWGWYLARLQVEGLGIAGMGLLALGAIGLLLDTALRGMGSPMEADTRLRRHRLLIVLVMLIVALGWFAWLGSVRVRFERNLMMSVALSSVAAGYGLATLLRALAARSHTLSVGAALALVAAILAGPGSKTAEVLVRLRSQDTRSLAAAWLSERLDPGTAIAREEYTPQLDAARYRVEYLWSLALRDPSEYQTAGTELVVASQAVYGRFFNNPGEQPQMLERYQRVFSWPKVVSFAPGPGTSGPVIDVFEVPGSRDSRAPRAANDSAAGGAIRDR